MVNEMINLNTVNWFLFVSSIIALYNLQLYSKLKISQQEKN